MLVDKTMALDKESMVEDLDRLAIESSAGSSVGRSESVFNLTIVDY